MTFEIQVINEKGIEAMQSNNWDLASRIFVQSLAQREDQPHVHYMLGQSYRFSGRYLHAIKELTRATELDGSHKEWFLALGIAFQLNENFDESLDALRRANVLDQDYDLAYNSAAITFRKKGDFAKAAELYDLCVEAIIRKFLFSTRNTRDQIPNVFFETGTHLYVDYTLRAIMEHAARSGVSQVSLPSGEFAASDHRDRNYGGLLWVDEKVNHGTNRLYLPNCFDTIRVILASTQLYYMCLENKGSALSELGEEDKAQECMKEANVFRRLFELRR